MKVQLKHFRPVFPADLHVIEAIKPGSLSAHQGHYSSKPPQPRGLMKQNRDFPLDGEINGVWMTPVVQQRRFKVRARHSLSEGLSWGPYQGNIHSEPASPGHADLAAISPVAPYVQTTGTG
uniref:Zinc finger protein ZFPM1/2 PR domain-containing protein n=1 Tax=Varanus komodoensis TaxID=61221 RepID=A0A8D2LF92_VARKO